MVVNSVNNKITTSTVVAGINRLKIGAISRPAPKPVKPRIRQPAKVAPASTANTGSDGKACNTQSGIMRAIENYRTGSSQRGICPLTPAHAVDDRGAGDRESVVTGRRVSVSVDLGCRRVIKNNKEEKNES